jgi:DNA-binding NarL/FixJ family response regulator
VDVYRPDVLLWDLGSDTASGVELMADVDEAGVPVVALVADDVHAAEARAAGALGLVARDLEAERLLATIGAVSKGMLVFDPEMAPPALQDGGRPPQAADLTPRELEVLRLLAEGLANKAIAHRLDVSEHTVKFHVNSILGKLGAQSRTDAVVRATRLGLILL